MGLNLNFTGKVASAGKHEKPTKSFANSVNDLFHEKMSFGFLDKVFEAIVSTLRHHYQILTKRELILQKYFSEKTVPANVWLGVMVEYENTKYRVDVLKKSRFPFVLFP